MSPRNIVIRVLFFQEPNAPGVWIAQALEHDIAAFGPDVERAKTAFERTLSGYFTQLDGRALDAIEPAPAMFWDIWDAIAEQRVQAERMPSIPAFMMPVVSHDPLPA